MTPQSKRFQDKTLEYIMSLLGDIRYWESVDNNPLFVSLVLDAQLTLNKLRMELNETN